MLRIRKSKTNPFNELIDYYSKNSNKSKLEKNIHMNCAAIQIYNEILEVGNIKEGNLLVCLKISNLLKL